MNTIDQIGDQPAQTDEIDRIEENGHASRANRAFHLFRVALYHSPTDAKCFRQVLGIETHARCKRAMVYIG